MWEVGDEMIHFYRLVMTSIKVVVGDAKELDLGSVSGDSKIWEIRGFTWGLSL